MSVDLTGKFLVSATWVLMLYANYVTVVQIFNPWFIDKDSQKHIILPYTTLGSFLFIVYEALNVLAASCHVISVFGDPGTTIKLTHKAPPENFTSPRICKLCGFRWKPPRAHHCRKCKVCVFRMDHHCAWIDNCVGILNQKFFILFLVYTGILCGYQIVLILFCIIFWIKAANFSIAILPTCLVISVFAESTIFLYMTTDFFTEQLDALETNSSLIESHQHTHGTQKPFWSIVLEVFGTNTIWWFLPVAPKLRLDFTEPVFLDKAVAVQLLHKQKRNEFRDVDNANTDTSTTLLTKKVEHTSDLRSRKGVNRQNVLFENPMLPPADLKDANLWPVDLGSAQHFSTASPQLTYIKQDTQKSDESTYEESQYKNVYMRPWTDIGVELDDESRFIQLDDFADESIENSVNELYNSEDVSSDNESSIIS